MKSTSQDKVNSIIMNLNNGLSYREIAKIMNVSHVAIHKIVKKNKIDSPTNKGGRPAKLNSVMKRNICRNILSGKCDNATQAAKLIQEYHEINVSPQTIRNVLKEGGFKAKHKVKKPAISKKNQKKRLEFARKHKDWTYGDWKRVIWSDETKINRLGSDGRVWCWKMKGDGLLDRIVQPTLKHGGGSVMVWGCMTAYGVGYLSKIEGGMDADLYCKILEEDLTETMKYYDMEPLTTIFQHDNDPKHTSRKAKKCLEDLNINVLEWPAQSPDLNPIEHLWDVLKRKLALYPNVPEGIHMLWDRIEDEWNKISQEECLSLIQSMPRRVKAVLKAKGRNTKY